MVVPDRDTERWPAPFLVRDDDLLPGYPPDTLSSRRAERRRVKRRKQLRRFATVLTCIALVPLTYWGIAVVWGLDVMFGAIGFTPVTLLGLLILALIWDRCGATD